MQGAESVLAKLINVVLSEVANPVFYVVSALCFVWFLFGIVRFLWAKNLGDQGAIDDGKRNMLWGIVGLLIMFSAGAIYNFITSFFQ